MPISCFGPECNDGLQRRATLVGAGQLGNEHRCVSWERKAIAGPGLHKFDGLEVLRALPRGAKTQWIDCGAGHESTPARIVDLNGVPTPVAALSTRENRRALSHHRPGAAQVRIVIPVKYSKVATCDHRTGLCHWRIVARVVRRARDLARFDAMVTAGPFSGSPGR